MTRAVSRSITIDADPTTVFDVLADPAQHPLFDGSETVKGRLTGPPRLYLGAKWRVRMHLVLPYVVTNQVVEYDEDRVIAWRHFARHIWRYELTPVDGQRGPATQVTESWDWSGGLPVPKAYELIGFPERNAEGIEASLQRLKVLIESRTRTAS